MSGLRDRRVLVTRARHQARALCEALERYGAEPVLFPTIEFQPVEDLAPVDSAIAELGEFAWVVFTSANGVRFFLDRMTRLTATFPATLRIAAIGSVTERALRERGVTVDAVPEEFRGERMPAVLGELSGRRVLLPRAAIGREEIVEKLRASGAVVEDVAVYQTMPATPEPEALRSLRAGVDVVTFTSPSTLRNFLTLLGAEGGEVLASATVACIGPVTAEAARELGVRVDVQPAEHTVEALARALSALLPVTSVPDGGSRDRAAAPPQA